jgi:hypothetical protein
MAYLSTQPEFPRLCRTLKWTFPGIKSLVLSIFPWHQFVLVSTLMNAVSTTCTFRLRGHDTLQSRPALVVELLLHKLANAATVPLVCLAQVLADPRLDICNLW